MMVKVETKKHTEVTRMVQEFWEEKFQNAIRELGERGSRIGNNPDKIMGVFRNVVGI